MSSFEHFHLDTANERQANIDCPPPRPPKPKCLKSKQKGNYNLQLPVLYHIITNQYDILYIHMYHYSFVRTFSFQIINNSESLSQLILIVNDWENGCREKIVQAKLIWTFGRWQPIKRALNSLTAASRWLDDSMFFLLHTEKISFF